MAHGKLKGFNFAAIRAMTGVIDVITHEDIPGRNECGAVFIDDDKVLAEGTVRFFGQPVFAVIATTREAARRAAALAKDALDIEPLEPVLTARAAHARGEYVIPPMNLSRNTSHPDTATALAAAKHRIKRTLEVGGQEQFYLEGQISYAVPREDDGLLVYCSTQHPSEMQHAISHVMGLSAN